MNDTQVKLLEIWKEFDRVCEKLNIKYFAMGGTLLGAMRHKGFIPWDDDMDFGILRDEYERFLKEAPKEFASKYFVQEHRTEKTYFYPFIKIRDSETTAIEWDNQNVKINHGLWIDVFPIDKLPDIEQTKKNDQEFKDRMLRFALSYRVPGKTLTKKLLKPVKHFLYFLKYPSLEKNYQKVEELIQKYNSGDYDYATFVWYTNKAKYRYPIKMFEQTKRVEFEGCMMSVPYLAVEMLEISFGDWKKPPPESERYTHPLYKLDLNKSYKEYLK